MEKIQVRLLHSIKFHIWFKEIANATIIVTVIATELPRWNKAQDPGKGNVVLPGLIRRRNAEIALAQQSSSVFTYPCTDPDNDGDPGDPNEGSE
jgi:hypothetical protein